MRKIIAAILLTCFLCLNASYAVASTGKIAVVRTEIETKDGFTLVGDFYPSKTKGKKMPLVILLHSFGGKAGDWGTLPEKIVRGGNNVFALDLRGHGRSVYNANFAHKSYKYFNSKAWARLPNDVLQTINYLKETYAKVDYDNITFVGADLGANTAVLAANGLKNKPEKMVLISPSQNFKGLYIPVVIANLAKTHFLIMVSKADRHFFNEANLLSRFIQGPHIIKTYNEGGSGTLFLKKNPSSYDEIVKYIYDPIKAENPK